MKTPDWIDPDCHSRGTRFDTNREKFTVFQAAMLWTGQEPAEDGFLCDDVESRWRLDKGRKYQKNHSVYVALINAIEKKEITIIPIRKNDGSIDGFKTLIHRDKLTAWARNMDESPDFLCANATYEETTKNAPPQSPTTDTLPVVTAKPPPKMREQENQILDWLKENGHDAQNLPKVKNGCPTAKADARAALNGKGVFTAKTAFNKTWDRLRGNNEIKETEKGKNPTPPK